MQVRLRYGTRVDRTGRDRPRRGNGRSRAGRVLPSLRRARVRVHSSLGDAVHLSIWLRATGGCLPRGIPLFSRTPTAYSSGCGGRGYRRRTGDNGTSLSSPLGSRGRVSDMDCGRKDLFLLTAQGNGPGERPLDQREGVGATARRAGAGRAPSRAGVRRRFAGCARARRRTRLQAGWRRSRARAR